MGPGFCSVGLQEAGRDSPCHFFIQFRHHAPSSVIVCWVQCLNFLAFFRCQMNNAEAGATSMHRFLLLLVCSVSIATSSLLFAQEKPDRKSVVLGKSVDL